MLQTRIEQKFVKNKKYFLIIKLLLKMKPKTFLAALAAATFCLLLFVGCSNKCECESYLMPLTYEVSGKDTALFIPLAIKGKWKVEKNDGQKWCVLRNQLVPNAAKDSVEVILDIARNETNEIRISYTNVEYSFESSKKRIFYSEACAEFGVYLITVIQYPKEESD